MDPKSLDKLLGTPEERAALLSKQSDEWVATCVKHFVKGIAFDATRNENDRAAAARYLNKLA
jgi:hypothetical protein